MTAPAVVRDAKMRETPSGLVLPLPSPLLAMLPEELQGLPMQWFTFPINVLALAPNTAAQGSFTCDRNHAFACWFGTVSIRSSDNQTDRPTDPATYAMTDTQNNQYNPANFPILVQLSFGTSAASPGIWPSPLVVSENNGINLNVTNLHAANTNNLRFAFTGVLIDITKRGR